MRILAIAFAASLAACDGFVGDVEVTDKPPARTEALKSYRLPTTSMEPTIARDNEILVDESAFTTVAPRRGDVVTYRLPTNPETLLVKRIVALPGETVRIARKELFVDDSRLDEPYAVHNDPNDYTGTDKPEPYRSRDSFGPHTLPADHFFVLGDNRDSSMDSRYHGTVPRKLIAGKVLRARNETGIRDVQ